MFEKRDYTNALCKLAALQAPVDRFFDDVMVMDEDSALRDNRLALLNALSKLFLQVADISRLQN
jgi:glycyl-tRNA synthetase beta chain